MSKHREDCIKRLEKAIESLKKDKMITFFCVLNEKTNGESEEGSANSILWFTKDGSSFVDVALIYFQVKKELIELESKILSNINPKGNAREDEIANKLLVMLVDAAKKDSREIH